MKRNIKQIIYQQVRDDFPPTLAQNTLFEEGNMQGIRGINNDPDITVKSL